MATHDQTAPLWMLISGMESEACQNWHRLYGGATDFETALAADVKWVETNVERKPGGNVSVTVSIHSVRLGANHVEWFALQRSGNKHYRRTTTPLTAG